LHPDTEILAEGKHPFALLLILIEQWRELSEDHWGLLKATVEHSFGQSLSVEAARGNLIIPGEVAVTITSAVPEKGDGIARPIESPASSVEISEDISPKSQMIPKNAGAVIPPIAEMTQSLPEVRNREISSSQEKTRHLSKEGKSS